MRKKCLACLCLAVCLIAACLQARASKISGERERVCLPILMYHRVSRDAGLQGRFCISPQGLERDLAFLRDNGYECVVFADVLAFAEGRGALPEKPVMLTFDDGNYSDYRYVLPTLKKYEAKAVLSILGKEADTYTEDGRSINYPNLTWPQIAELSKSGLVEIQSHGYDLHGPVGALKRKGESAEDYEKRLSGDLLKLQQKVEEMTGTVPSLFAYPKGKFSPASEKIIKSLGFKGSLGCEEGVNDIELGKPEKLFKLKRMIRTNGNSAQSILQKAMKKD